MNNSNQAKNLMSEEAKLNLAYQFLSSLKTKDWNLLRSLLTDDSTWTLPGASIISGEAIGIDAVIKRAQLIVSFGVSLQLNHVLYGMFGFALSVHNQAIRGGIQLDEHLATVCVLRDGKIASINTYLSDVPGVNAFFTVENRQL